ncbi:DUF5686 and carboxypeptidase regulatory-like domain-containing protein [Paraflavitalea sp. CAU 1676]|uniref:DUF5686 and carboxypeptidase regulatory-like domain-containing protein n=1 Tax=Paraflavitalea sp. CAU 1676 TaxID=3032598 RepID=UPI0023DA4649|nr:DUF5686 and carboxypeptidase regulatory-like domain-containing protein [Paraflavitalea sp. CAU 1676]MDF2188872.1 DUF5686 and carboxypeptidase regulatory-like domain-containing protein [Paraflavitalea sp. CAU 1676]
MTKTVLLLPLLLLSTIASLAGRVSGTVKNQQGENLPYASVFVKGTTTGTTTNSQGSYFLDLAPGQYTLVCQYVGYAKIEKAITVTNAALTVHFELSVQQTSMKEVVVRANAEDPAYEIIRNAIKKKKEYVSPLDSFTCEAYIKTLVKTRKVPNKVLGQKIKEEDKKEMGVDSVGKGIIHLSESLTKIAFKKPNKIKLEVLSGRESGSSGYGFNFPTFINFYNDNVNVLTSQLNPRGFVSPIADAAFSFYAYKYLGSFWEDGKEINQIQVISRRNYEPLFNGTINITEGDWRIHSLELLLTKKSQLEILDTMRIKQIHVPVSPNVWQTKDQVVYFTFNIMGFDAVGNFLNVYNKYEVTPTFNKKYFNNVVIKYDTAVNKRSKHYWDSIRPVQLELEEVKDYKVKDSLREYRRDSVWTKAYTDSMRRKQGKVTFMKVFYNGFTRRNYKADRPMSFTWKPLIQGIQYNTVEGLALNAEATLQRSFPKTRQQISLTPHVRYGFSNQHLNAWATLQYWKRSFTWEEDGGTTSRSVWSLAGGKRVSQFNQDNPITPLMNSVYTLFVRRNYMKIYENYFGKLTFNKRFDSDLRITADLLYEDRIPIDNTTDFSIFKDKDKVFTPNYPYEQLDEQFTKHQALIASIGVQFQPGQRYIQYPNNKFPIGSKYPTFAVSYKKGIDNLLGSDVDFDKWTFSVWDNMNFKLRGAMSYRLGIGGFINDSKVPIQDYQHFNGNQLIFASKYLNSFQLAPYYANSTTASFYAVGHLEHHFNGFLTNKIPLFKRLNWHLVGGGNAFFVNKNNNYVEVFGGLENIFKLIRVDVVASYLNGNKGQVGLRIGLGGLLGSAIQLPQ